MSTEGNENWTTCPKCGAPVLIDPRTSTPEACSNCTSKESPVGLWTGSTAILFGVVAVILLLALCYYLLFTGE